MSQKEEKDPVYPEGYEHVKDRVDLTTEQLRQIDKQMETVPQDAGPVLTLNPPGSFKSRTLGSREQRLAFLKDQKDRIKTDAWEKTEADTRNAENKTVRVVRDDAREKLFPNPFRQMTDEEKAFARSQPKDIEVSQNYMDAKLVEMAAQRKAAEKGDKPATKQQDKTEMSMSARFSMSLGYTKASERTERAVEPARDRQPDKDRD